MGNVKKLKLEIEKRIMGLLIMIIPPTQVISRNYKTMQRDVIAHIYGSDSVGCFS
jgi:hypothetical protein